MQEQNTRATAWRAFRTLAAAAAAFSMVIGPAALGAPAKPAARPIGAAAVDSARLLAADAEPGSWMASGRTYSEQRYSPLTGVNKANVSKLGLAWYGDIDTERGQESTPVVVDGALYITTAWSKVKAYDAKTGKKLWDYDPKVDPANGAVACCDVVNRGIAAWQGKIYLGALDGRLIALDG
ncbi:MAG TPA: PQQ-binding-like beta-propeller repeat protein, partial [Phenylobacterium sp.]|nr:PQQ-binding-like beta-propeller repeat protein [Phenylobacterium sp.]